MRVSQRTAENERAEIARRKVKEQNLRKNRNSTQQASRVGAARKKASEHARVKAARWNAELLQKKASAHATKTHGECDAKIAALQQQMAKLHKTDGELFSSGDLNRDNKLTFKKFCRGVAMIGVRPVPTQEEMKLLFEAYDRDNNGYVDWNELHNPTQQQPVVKTPPDGNLATPTKQIQNQAGLDLEVGATDSNYNDEESGQTSETLYTDADLDKEFCELSAVWDADEPRASAGGGMVHASSTVPELHVQPGSPDESIGEAALSHVQQQQLLWREQMELVEAEVTGESADVVVRKQAEIERIEAVTKETDEQMRNRLQAVKLKAEAEERQRCSTCFVII